MMTQVLNVLVGAFMVAVAFMAFSKFFPKKKQ